MVSHVEMLCPVCKTPFQKELREIRRRRKDKPDVEFYCSRSCGGVGANKGRPLSTYADTKANLKVGREIDEQTPFRWFLARAHFRRKKGGRFSTHDLTLDYLVKLWASQAGLCPFTGWALLLPKDSSGWPAGKHPRNASLDRINHTKGYVRGNVRFVSLIANIARGDFADSDVFEFCEAVSKAPRPKSK